MLTWIVKILKTTNLLLIGIWLCGQRSDVMTSYIFLSIDVHLFIVLISHSPYIYSVFAMKQAFVLNEFVKTALLKQFRRIPW